jgi:hypothetical protein
MAEREQWSPRSFLFGNHRAWTFDPAAFHHWLEERAIVGDELRLDLLLEFAKNVVTDASPTTWDALDWVRYDEELLENDEGLLDGWYSTESRPLAVVECGSFEGDKPAAELGFLELHNFTAELGC